MRQWGGHRLNSASRVSVGDDCDNEARKQSREKVDLCLASLRVSGQKVSAKEKDFPQNVRFWPKRKRNEST